MTFAQKILLLGNESRHTDEISNILALSDNTLNHGLINDANFNPEEFGYYHTTVGDMSPGDIMLLSKKFNCVKLLDQPRSSYTHFKSFVTTIRLMQDLEDAGINVDYKNTSTAKNVLWWRQYLKENKSFCFHPFSAVIDNAGSTTICSKSYKPLTKVENIKDWQNDPVYSELRNKMAAGELLPEYCFDCYDREKEGLESARQYETLDWTQRLGLESVDDFFKIKSPSYFEIRPSNKCNIMCRMCDDGHSHLIEKEFKTLNIPLVQWKFTNTSFSKIDFSTIDKIYVGGGEPTIMPEFYDFLRKCIDSNNTKFELLIGTNGVFFSPTLIKLLDNFSNVCFSFSYDGYRQVNDYIRWGSNFDTMVSNSRLLRERGHKIALQTVFSMWNATSIHEIFEFFDDEYPNSGLLVQPAEGTEDGFFLPYNHPRPDLVLESMEKTIKTKIYYGHGRSIKSMVDSMIAHYSNNYKCDIELLSKFYNYNDKLDHARNSKLSDYIPELAEARKLYNI